MDKSVSPVVLILAMLMFGVHADELVLQLNGEVASFPESMIIAKIQSGVIDPNPVVNERGLRYFVQIARNNVGKRLVGSFDIRSFTSDITKMVFPFGWQTIVPYGQRRIPRLGPNIQRSINCNPCNAQKAAPSQVWSTPPPTSASLNGGVQWVRPNGPGDLLHPSQGASRVVQEIVQERSAQPRRLLPSAVQTRQLFLDVSNGVAPPTNENRQNSASYVGGRVSALGRQTLRSQPQETQPQGPQRLTEMVGSSGVRSPVLQDRLVTGVTVMMAPSADMLTTITPRTLKPKETLRLFQHQDTLQTQQIEKYVYMSTVAPVKQTTDKSVTVPYFTSTPPQTESTTAATTTPKQSEKAQTTTSYSSD